MKKLHNEHLDKVQDFKTDFEKIINKCKMSDDRIQCLTFDLQKTLEATCLSTSVVYYKRQLWTYNLCIFDEVKKEAYMYVWSENVASRGAQEVGSCLLKHFKTYLSEKTEKIAL